VCGKVGKVVFAQINEPPIRIRDSVGYKSTREFYEKHHEWAALVIAITVISSVFGIIPLGIWGVILGLILGVISYYIGPKAETKVREIRYGQST
jgi:xanthine/uracil permease